MLIKNFIEKYEITSKKSIDTYYENIDMLYYELNFLNDLLLRYSNKKSGYSFSVYERHNEMSSIRERIPKVYEDINYYKECINIERKEIKRIYNTYGYTFISDSNKEEKYIQLTNKYDITKVVYEEYIYGDNEEKEENEEEDEEEEEIKEYKYNPVTDTFE